LVTAASYGEAEMVRALIDSGADLEATGVAVPGGTALAHAVEFGNSVAVDVLADAGAVVHDLTEAAGVGNLNGHDLAGVPPAARARAARAAAVCERLDALDKLIASGVPVDADPDTGRPDGSRTLLHEAAYWGKPRSVERLLALGADPDRRDAEYQATPLGWCRHRHGEIVRFGAHLTAGHEQVEHILRPITSAE
jgi:ankyrin repeat protein